MGDLLGQQPAPNADPSTGLGTQAAAAGQPQGGLGGTLTSGLNNPLIQMLLGTYAGAVGSPKQEGLGGAIKGGIGGGLSLYNQARQQQMQIPLQQAQLQEAQLKAKQLGMELRPLTQEEVQGLDEWVKTLPTDPKDPNYDPYELAYARQLEGLARGQQITGPDMLKSITAFKEASIMQALFKNKGLAQGQALINQVLPPGTLGGPPQQGQTSPGTQQPPSPYAAMQFPKPGGPAQMMDLPGIGNVPVRAGADGTVYRYDVGNKQWVAIPLQ